MNPLEEAVTYLKKTELLSGLDDDSLERTAATLRKALHTASSVIVKEGEPGDALCLITRGLVEVKKREPTLGVDLTVAKMRPGDCFPWATLQER